MNKIALGIAVLALIVSGFAFVTRGDNSQAVGGFSNYDQLALSSTSPSTGGDLVVDSAATTTVFVSSSTSGKGGCIQLRSTAGGSFYAYATTSGPVYWNTGTCR